jgi:hypothetical protein
MYSPYWPIPTPSKLIKIEKLITLLAILAQPVAHPCSSDSTKAAWGQKRTAAHRLPGAPLNCL